MDPFIVADLIYSKTASKTIIAFVCLFVAFFGTDGNI